MNVIPIIDLVAVVALLVWRLTLTPRHLDPSIVDDGIPPVLDTSLDRARATLDWAGGSRADWDRHVRPVLARELTEVLRARREPAATNAGSRVFGPDLWSLVDPNQAFPDPDRPGPGRDGLAQILDRLERL